MGHGDTNVRKAVENGTALDVSGAKFAIPGPGWVRYPCAPAGPKIDKEAITAVLMDATILLLHIFSGMKSSGTSVKRIARIFHDKIGQIRRVYPNVRIIELFADVTDRTPLTKSIEQQARAGVRKRLDSEEMRVLRESEDGTIAAADAVYATKCKDDKNMDARTVIFERMVPFLEILGTEAVLDGFQHHGDTGGRMCAYDLCTKQLRETHFNGENDTRMVRRAHDLFLAGESILVCSTDTDMYVSTLSACEHGLTWTLQVRDVVSERVSRALGRCFLSREPFGAGAAVGACPRNGLVSGGPSEPAVHEPCSGLANGRALGQISVAVRIQLCVSKETTNMGLAGTRTGLLTSASCTRNWRRRAPLNPRMRI